MTFLAALLIAFSGTMAMSGVTKQPLSQLEIIDVLRDCSDSGMQFAGVTSITGFQEKERLSIDHFKPDGLVTFLSEQEKKKQQDRLARSPVRVFEAWCEADEIHAYTGRRSYFKKPLEHTVLIDKLRECRRSQGVANKTPVDEYAIITTGNLSLEITGVECES